MCTVVVVGVTNVCMTRRVDEFPEPFVSSQRLLYGLSAQIAGSGFTVARTLRALGADVSLATYVGADPLGMLAVHWLREYGLYGSGVLRCESQPRAMVLYDRAGTRAGTTDLRDTTELRYPVTTFSSLVDTTSRCDMVVLGNIRFTRELIPTVLERRIPFATDLHTIDDVDSPHNKPWMRAATVLACSHERLPVTPIEWIRLLWRRYGTDVVLIGCGAGGVVLGERGPRRIWHVPAVAPRGVHCTDGGGDTLLAGFVHHYLDSGDAVVAAAHAALTAGWKVGGRDDTDVLSAGQLVSLRARHGLPAATRVS